MYSMNIVKQVTKTVVDYASLDRAIETFKREKGRNPYIMMNKFTFEKFYNYNRDIKILRRMFSVDAVSLRSCNYTNYTCYLYFDNEIFITSSIDDGNIELL